MCSRVEFKAALLERNTIPADAVLCFINVESQPGLPAVLTNRQPRRPASKNRDFRFRGHAEAPLQTGGEFGRGPHQWPVKLIPFERSIGALKANPGNPYRINSTSKYLGRRFKCQESRFRRGLNFEYGGLFLPGAVSEPLDRPLQAVGERDGRLPAEHFRRLFIR